MIITRNSDGSYCAYGVIFGRRIVVDSGTLAGAWAHFFLHAKSIAKEQNLGVSNAV